MSILNDPEATKLMREKYSLDEKDILKILEDTNTDIQSGALAAVDSVMESVKDNKIHDLIRRLEALVFMGLILGYSLGRDKAKNKTN